MAKNSRSTISRHAIVLTLTLGLFSWIFSDAIFRDRNFVYRDASQFYYPLLKLVQQEWEAGRWPLWNPQENAGMPLLGNPASAVLYVPRIVLFQWLPLSYAAAYKWYILLHVLLSALGAWLLARHFKLSELAAGLSAISYAFGAVVMFQYCNVIFLVGAAWVPFGLMSASLALERGDWRWAGVLGIVLALEVFGGDPEAAYVTGGLAAVYLMMIDLPFAMLIASGIALWFPLRWYMRGRPSVSTLSWDFMLPCLTALALFLVAFVCWWRARRKKRPPDEKRLIWRRRICLALAAVVGLGVSAVQWIPSWEFGRISNRAAGGVHYEPYAFWIAPWRFAEFLWPNVMGREFPIQTRWLDIFPVNDKVWEPSLYFGALPALLALSAWGLRRVPHWQRWLSVILVLSLCGATGPGGGISWYLTLRDRVAILTSQTRVPDASSDAANAQGRAGPDMQTPAGGMYWLLLELLPGFDTFRFPAKLMTFAAIAFAVLAGIGWDRLFGDSRGGRRVMLLCIFASAALAVLALVKGGQIIAWLDSSWMARGSSYYGPLVATQAWNCIFRAFTTTAALLGIVLALLRFGQRRPGVVWIPAVALALVVVDIGLANKWMVVTSAQSSIDAEPELVKILRDAEAAQPNDEPEVPFRIHRISVWTPPRWNTRTSTSAAEETYLWEKATIQPKHGLPFGVHYTINEGTLEPYDYWWFFAPFFSNTTREPKSVVYYPQRGFDMWGARYFVLPYWLDPKDQNRGFSTFLRRSVQVAESETDDYQVRRNLSVYPRAWIVHQLIYQTPIEGLARADRTNRMRVILYEGFDPLWSEEALDGHVQDPRRVAWIEDPDAARVFAYADHTADRSADRCRIVRYEPDRVEVEVESAGRGVLILADLLYPGWKVTIDGKPGTILRANRIMRGVPILPGKHHIVFTFEPLSVRVGAAISGISVTIILLACAPAAWRRLRKPQRD